MSWRPTRIKVEPHPSTWKDAGNAVLKAAPAAGPESYCLVQSFPKLCFERFDGSIPYFEASFSGRIFSKDSEVRWLRDQDKCQIWQFFEPGDNTGDVCEYRERRYYLWGIWKGGEFREDRIPRESEIKYPLPRELAPKQDDRAFITVREYRASKPGKFSADPQELSRLLNGPKLMAHRFISLGVGRDEYAADYRD